MLKWINILLWGGLALLLVGIALNYQALVPYLASALGQATPTPVPLATPTATLIPAPGTTPDVETPPQPGKATATPLPTPAWEGQEPVRLTIPTINLEATIEPIGWKMTEFDGAMQAIWDVPDRRAVGWHETSAALGVPGNTVLNGHNTSRGEVFRYLHKLEAGDVITVEAENGAFYTYEVAEKLILPEAGQPIEVRLENASYTLPTEDERLTLVTCHPYASLANRLILIAYPLNIQGE